MPDSTTEVPELVQSITRPRTPARIESFGELGRGGRLGSLGKLRNLGRSDRPVARQRFFWAAVILAVYLVEVAFRLYLVRGEVAPSVGPDEEAYLVVARVLAGGSVTASPAGVVVPGGYPLLIAPALAIAGNPVTAYRLVLVTNALLSALIVPLAFVALRRMRIGRRSSLAVAGTVGLLPPVVFYSQFAMTESVLPSVVLAWLLCLHGLLTDHQKRQDDRTQLRARYGVGFGLAAGYAMSVHDRGVVLVVVSIGVLLVALVRRWVPSRAALAAGVALAVAVLGAELLAAYLQQRFSDTPPATVGQFALNGLLNTSLLGRSTGRVLGQIWYLITSTWGIGALGAALCAAVAVRRRATPADRVVSAVLLITVVLVAGAAATALPEDHRLDDNVYARYLSVFAPALFVVGVAALYRLRRTALLRYAAGALALIGVCGGGVFLLAGTRLRHDLFVLWGLPDSSFLAGDYQTFHLVRTTLAAVAVFAVCVAATALLGRRRGVRSAVVLLAGFAVAATTVITVEISEPQQVPRWLSMGFTRAAGLHSGDRVAMSYSLPWVLKCEQPFELYQERMWILDFRRAPVPPTADVAVLPARRGAPATSSWPHVPHGWHVAKVDRGEGFVVWRR
ncbi:ArnT family glycosyltransferase [Streptacidiphilus fuscans]|uniref:Phospholipid carrier-dependent glycosyltransferase n=1 Tax=Streptacidiphilus fuscans TaxID=2789292 RepID=A0A931FFH2_9ACTN|nr:phospholipid carrier-dependent glycosyltransferase [Streptacidiphilus fuscans]MBF9071656.1 phospholipid carrier-dependent glycosyltransferase [Streptacidiphilus fuscans]MBF9072857.1 phospholipid carrier-dependent glycosyltransferase [Streptacidiphilus fuscans]